MDLGALVVLAVVGVVGLLVLEVTIRRTDVGAALVLLLLVVEEAAPGPALGVPVGPFFVHVGDLLFVLLVAAAAARMLRSRRLSTPQRLMVAFTLLVLWSTARGWSDFGVQESINNGRVFLRFAAAALYFSTVQPREDILDRVGRLWVAASAALVALVVLRWAALAAGVSGGILGAPTDLRVVPADAALVIAQGALLSLPMLADRGRGLLRFIAPVFLVAVLLLQHRSVWVVTVAGIAYLLYRERALGRELLVALLAGLALVSILGVVLFGGQAELQVGDELAESAQNSDTFVWRAEGWRALMRDSGPEDAAEWVAGRSMGSGWDRVLSHGRTVYVSPHNFYLESLLRVGVVGLAALLLVYAIVLRDTAVAPPPRGAKRPALPVHVLHVLVAVQLLFYIPYSTDTTQGLLLGLGCAAATRGALERRSIPRTVAV